MHRIRIVLLLTVLLSVGMLTGLAPAVNKTEAHSYIMIGGQNLLADADMTLHQGDAWVAYSPIDHTLTFSGGYYVRYAPKWLFYPGAVTVEGLDGLTVRVLGEKGSCIMLDTAQLSGVTDEDMLAAIYAPETNLTFVGGSLRCEIALPEGGGVGCFRGIAAKSIQVNGASLNVEVGDTVTTPQPDLSSLADPQNRRSGTIGIHTGGNFTAQGTSRVQVTVGENEKLSTAIRCEGSFTVRDSAQLVLNGGDSHTYETVGLDIEQNLTVTGGSLDVSAGRAHYAGSAGIRAFGKTEISGGCVEARAGNSIGLSVGLYVGHGSITGGSVTAASGDFGEMCEGIYIHTPLQPFVISGNALISGKAGQAEKVSHDIYVQGELKADEDSLTGQLTVEPYRFN